jgi:hypothetical protein
MQLYLAKIDVLVSHAHWRTKRNHPRTVHLYVNATSKEDAETKAKSILLKFEVRPPTVFGSKQTSHSEPLRVYRDAKPIVIIGPLEFAIEPGNDFTYTE